MQRIPVMDFVFSGGVPLGNECRRLILSEIEGALGLLGQLRLGDADLVVHEVRKQNKRIRGLLRLARPLLESGDLSEANRLVRDAARRLADARDTRVRLEICEMLAAHFPTRGMEAIFATAMESLSVEHQRLMEDPALDKAAATARTEFAEAARIVEEWDWSQLSEELIFSAVVSNYRIGISDYDQARFSRDPHECHEWRKRAKYLSFHLQLLSFLDPVVLGERARLVEELASWLGEHHDLAVLEARFADYESLGLTPEAAGQLIHLAKERRSELEELAFARGAIVYADPPEALRDRLREKIAMSS